MSTGFAFKYRYDTARLDTETALVKLESGRAKLFFLHP